MKQRVVGEVSAFGLLDGNGDRVGLALIAEIAKNAPLIAGPFGKGGQHFRVGAQRGGVVFTAGPDLRCPQRPAVGRGEDLDVAAMVVVFARPPQIDLHRWPRSRQRSVSINVPSTLTCS
jgi:hypothetical protein